MVVRVPAVSVSFALNKTDPPRIGEIIPSAPLFTQTESVQTALKVIVLDRYALADDLNLRPFAIWSGFADPYINKDC